MTVENPPAPPPRFQFTLWTFLLVAAAISAWVAYFQAQAEQAQLQVDLRTLRQISRALVIEDPTQYAVIQQHTPDADVHHWRVFLPEGASYRLCWIIPGNPSIQVPSANSSDPIPAGFHEVEIRAQQTGPLGTIHVVVDGQVKDPQPVQFTAPSNASESISTRSDRSRLQSTDKPFILTSERFLPTTVWFEKVAS